MVGVLVPVDPSPRQRHAYSSLYFTLLLLPVPTVYRWTAATNTLAIHTHLSHLQPALKPHMNLCAPTCTNLDSRDTPTGMYLTTN